MLLRYVNAGTLYRSMAVLGADQAVVALDGSPLNFLASMWLRHSVPDRPPTRSLPMPDAASADTQLPGLRREACCCTTATWPVRVACSPSSPSPVPVRVRTRWAGDEQRGLWRLER